jgi:hypothetical protein
MFPKWWSRGGNAGRREEGGREEQGREEYLKHSF